MDLFDEDLINFDFELENISDLEDIINEKIINYAEIGVDDLQKQKVIMESNYAIPPKTNPAFGNHGTYQTNYMLPIPYQKNGKIFTVEEFWNSYLNENETQDGKYFVDKLIDTLKNDKKVKDELENLFFETDNVSNNNSEIALTRIAKNEYVGNTKYRYVGFWRANQKKFLERGIGTGQMMNALKCTIKKIKK